MSKANWADEEESDEDITPEEVLQDQLLNQVDKARGVAPRKENRDRSGSNISAGSGDRSRHRGHRDQPQGGGLRQEGRGGYRNDRSGDGYDGGRGGGGGGGGYASGPPMEVPQNGPYIAYVGNLSYSSGPQVVGEYFLDGGCDVIDCKILTDRDGRPRGYANVTFSDRESLVKSLEADNTELDGRNISVRVDRKSGTDRKKGYEQRGGGGPGGAADEDGAWSRGARKDGPGLRNKEQREKAREAPERKTAIGGGDVSAPKTRPALNLAPRTVPLDAAPATEGARPSSIFGDAKPVDVKEKPDPTPKANKPREKKEREEKKEKKGGNGDGASKEWGRGTDTGKKGAISKDIPKKKDKDSKVSASYLFNLSRRGDDVAWE